MNLNSPVELKGVERILIIKLRQIGDTLLTVPAIRAVRERFPSAFIAVLVAAGSEAMLTGHPLIDEVIVYDRTRRPRNFFTKAKQEISFVREIRRRRFDLAIDLTSGDRPALLAYLSGARYRVGADPKGKGFWGKRFLYTHRRRFDNNRNHMVEQNLDVVRQVGIDTDDRSLSIVIPEEEARSVARLLGPKKRLRVHLHPTSNWLFKCWPDDRMAALIDLLSEAYRSEVILTCGPGPREMDRARRVIDLARRKPVDLIGKTTLKQLAAISQSSDLFIGVDTAPMHIAAAVGTPVVAIFGPTGEYNWRPWGEGHRVVAKEMPCRACGKAGCDDSGRSECLESLSFEGVWDAVEKTIQEIGERRDV